MKKLYFFLMFILATSYCFSWEKFYSKEGSCEIAFPEKPHHMKQVIPIQQTNEVLNYDVYLSLVDKDNSICMMVVASFPSKFDPANQRASLESFLNGIVNHKNDKKVIYADFSMFNNMNALDFLLENQNRFFKGKVFIKDNRLYLIAMEYNNNLNLDTEFQKYVSSFLLK